MACAIERLFSRDSTPFIYIYLLVPTSYIRVPINCYTPQEFGFVNGTVIGIAVYEEGEGLPAVVDEEVKVKEEEPVEGQGAAPSSSIPAAAEGAEGAEAASTAPSSQLPHLPKQQHPHHAQQTTTASGTQYAETQAVAGSSQEDEDEEVGAAGGGDGGVASRAASADTVVTGYSGGEGEEEEEEGTAAPVPAAAAPSSLSPSPSAAAAAAAVTAAATAADVYATATQPSEMVDDNDEVEAAAEDYFETGHVSPLGTQGGDATATTTGAAADGEAVSLSPSGGDGGGVVAGRLCVPDQ